MQKRKIASCYSLPFIEHEIKKLFSFLAMVILQESIRVMLKLWSIFNLLKTCRDRTSISTSVLRISSVCFARFLGSLTFFAS